MNNQSSWKDKEIKGYRILDKLRSSYLSTTFKAIGISDGKLVALKILGSDLDELKPEYRRRFEREIKILDEMEHPNILKLKAHSDYEGRPYFVTDFKGGGNLRKYLDNFSDGLDIKDVLKLFKPIAQAVDHAHKAGIIHRDLKPENVVLQETFDEAIPYLSDFGIAAIMDGTRHTGTSLRAPGTLQYMAPEMWKSHEKKTNKVDIYALGVMLYEALEGKVPFEGNELELLNLHESHKIPYPHATAKRTNRQVVKVLFKALSKDPNKRYESASELINRLKTAYRTGEQEYRKELLSKIAVWLTVAGLFVTLIGSAISSDWFSNWLEEFFSPPLIALTDTATITATHRTITITPTVTFTPAPPTLTPIVLGETIRNLVWLRTGPGENYHALATYGKGIIVTILGQSEDGNWLVVLLPDGSEGWVSSISIQPNVSIPNLLVVTAPPTETPRPPLPPITFPLGTRYPIGDINHDCVVDSGDTDYVQAHYQESGGAADLNGDGTVNIVDMGIVIDHMGETCP